ncbi:hypothetical protein [Streptomyces guryensis]|uniref:Cupin domain-containing protein n=1 Tax=Streptomyces guryensis TaxID=2886947 RepID=A0A9Q3VWW0_9ACTN|nr:hypothetical protein [Streptomyces guryensis]MCD9878933.1 hypothetical protein [Streptomyces guryensis]
MRDEPRPDEPWSVLEPWEAVGARLVVDEPAVKCWIEEVLPGESRPPHTHRHPWITVVLSGADGESRTPDGTLIAAGTAVEGTVRFNQPQLPFSHCMTNTSDRLLKLVAIELRTAPAAEEDGR